jgi:hypothetical protein
MDGIMDLTDFAHGRIAADLMNLSTADNVWRAIAKHGATYTDQTGNVIEVVTIGTKKAVRRDELTGFAAWYETAVRYPARRPQGTTITINPRRVSNQELKRRRLGVLIRQWKIAQEAGD